MGEAKRRGTYEQRVLAGEAKRDAEILRREEERKAREAAMTPEQKAKRVKTAKVIAMMEALVESNHM